MAYSELVKDLAQVREVLRQFYVYGFKSRSEYSADNGISTRTYDNERRRVESWLGEYMQFRQREDGKNSFLTLDSRSVVNNPLFIAFKAKSFTDKDILLHFYLLDMLADGCEKTAAEAEEYLNRDYFSKLDDVVQIEISTIRKKLKEYAELGLLAEEKRGNKLCYKRNASDIVLAKWRDALAFFSETMPVGVLGSTLLDKLPAEEQHFYHKHHYILQVLDSEYLLQLLLAMNEQRRVTLVNVSQRSKKITTHTILPLRIFHSTQMGKDYIFCYHYRFGRITSFRLDNIQSIEAGEADENYGVYSSMLDEVRKHTWGTSLGYQKDMDDKLEHVEMVLHVTDDEGYIVRRLYREKRCGRVWSERKNEYIFAADLYDALEMMPWVRTFIGRIVRFSCSNKATEKLFYDDLVALQTMYATDGGEGDAV